MAYADQILTASFDQGAAGTTDLIAAPGAGLHIVLLGILAAFDAAGTAQLRDSTPTAITGVMPVAANGNIIATPGNLPLGRCAANTKLQIVTATAKAKGVVIYAIEAA